MKPKYFVAHYDDDDSCGVAHLPSRGLGTSLLAELVRNPMVQLLELRDGSFADYLPCNKSWRLCSRKLKDVFDATAKPGDDLVWIPARVSNGNETRDYFVLSLTAHPEYIDASRSTYSAPGVVVKGVLDTEACGGSAIFIYDPYAHAPVVSSQVRDAIIAAGCTGIAFSKHAQS